MINRLLSNFEMESQYVYDILREYDYLESKGTTTQHSLNVCLNFGYNSNKYRKIWYFSFISKFYIFNVKTPHDYFILSAFILQ